MNASLKHLFASSYNTVVEISIIFTKKTRKELVKMKQEEIRRYIEEMLEEADIGVLRVIYRVLLGLMR